MKYTRATQTDDLWPGAKPETEVYLKILDIIISVLGKATA
jgi:hypothetical protein